MPYNRLHNNVQVTILAIHRLVKVKTPLLTCGKLQSSHPKSVKQNLNRKVLVLVHSRNLRRHQVHSNKYVIKYIH